MLLLIFKTARWLCRVVLHFASPSTEYERSTFSVSLSPFAVGSSLISDGLIKVSWDYFVVFFILVFVVFVNTYVWFRLPVWGQRRTLCVCWIVSHLISETGFLAERAWWSGDLVAAPVFPTQSSGVTGPRGHTQLFLGVLGSPSPQRSMAASCKPQTWKLKEWTGSRMRLWHSEPALSDALLPPRLPPTGGSKAGYPGQLPHPPTTLCVRSSPTFVGLFLFPLC